MRSWVAFVLIVRCCQTESKLSIREQLLLAQAVYQVQSSKRAKETVCSIAYSDICKTYLEKNQDHQSHSTNASQTLAVARQLYGTHLKLIAAALLEEERKSQNLQSEIEAIEHGEWDDKLKAAIELEKPTSVSNAEGNDVDKQSPVGDSLTAPVSPGHPHGKKSPISRSKRGTRKEDPSNSTKTHSKDNDVSLGTVPEVTRGCKRKAAPVNLSQRKIKKTSHQEPEKPLVTTPTESPETPNASESSASNDEETVMEQLTRTFQTSSSSSKFKSCPEQKTKAELHEDLTESKVSEKSLRSRTASGKVPCTNNQIRRGNSKPRKHEKDSEANAKPSNNESPGANVSTRGVDESHLAVHSPSSNKRSLLENDHSVDGSHVGSPNSASFATGMTDGNSTANQTPNSAKVPLFPADASSVHPRAGSC
ncbi:hypothetical protein KEM48_000257 [Puccinia striiformis f. sp. tritici PST-130]|nr:hypothetical protein KEM48_000257 [Puccinia striiformis f. sp. tritici PST-130]